MQSVILSGNTLCKIKRKFPLPPSLQATNHVTSVTEVVKRTDPSVETGKEPKDEEYDDYFVWRRNAPFIYDSLMVHRLDWPSLAVNFIPDTCHRSKGGFTSHKVIIGTHTSGEEVDYVIIGEVRLPATAMRENLTTCENFKGFFTYHKTHRLAVMGHPVPGFDTKAKLVHPGEVNRIAHCPKGQFTFATQTNYGDILIYDYSRHPSTPRCANKAAPQLVLTHGHTSEGYGLSWMDEHKLVSVSTDGSVCLWDTNAQSKTLEESEKYVNNTKCVEPLNKFSLKDAPLNDVQVMPSQHQNFMTVSDDCKIRLFDSRKNNCSGNAQVTLTAKSEVNCLSINEFNEHFVATGTVDGSICLWDVRNEKGAVLVLSHHTEPITQVEFCGASAGLLASASQDQKVYIWEISAEEKLKFSHVGHRGTVSDISWIKESYHKNGFALASVASDNSFHCFTPNFMEL
ncbi:WD40/YVTN repeat domain containing superfamily protein [Babesia gibsoni]|uniref:WD40/YVTN repeat domain containing superfamily protein n=1 Tax=Babesia gibsoni TaxID=33632 RepID=A0AAD8P996_BABGI|nr:WD40/YVTN repeat domain containing superfamily protein [Babesia gibsoni]